MSKEENAMVYVNRREEEKVFCKDSLEEENFQEIMKDNEKWAAFRLLRFYSVTTMNSYMINENIKGPKNSKEYKKKKIFSLNEVEDILHATAKIFFVARYMPTLTMQMFLEDEKDIMEWVAPGEIYDPEKDCIRI